jgi:hypothetical protein
MLVCLWTVSFPCRPSFAHNVKTRRNDAWAIEDEREEGIPVAGIAHAVLDLSEVSGLSCSTNCLALQANKYATVFTGTLKHVNCESCQFLVVDDVFFEWNRGVAMSGWHYKWPMKSQKTGMRTKRFFVLRDNILSYHKTKPTVFPDDDNDDLDSSNGRLTLTETSTIVRGRYFVTPCFTITTPYDTLWMKIKGDVGEQERWMDQIRLAIKQSAKSTSVVLIYDFRM